MSITHSQHEIPLTHEPPLRLLIVADMALQRAGLSALLAPIAQTHPVSTRAFDLLRDIGSHPHTERRAVAASHSDSVDAVIVVFDDAALTVAEPSVADGIAELATLGVPVMLLLADVDNAATHVAEWLARSVRAVLPLDAPVEELNAALRAAVAGLTVVEPGVAIEIARNSSRPRKSVKQTSLGGGNAPSLTGREREVLALLADGHATKTIARELGISAHTVKAHVESIFAKLGATTRAEAVAIGVRRGMVML